MTQFEIDVATRRLASIYCSAVDDGDAARMASLFAPGGRLVVFGAPAGSAGAAQPLRQWDAPDGLAKLVSVIEQTYSQWIHFLGNHWVDADGERANGEAYCVGYQVRADGANEEMAIIRYKDSYVLTPGGWRFEERRAFRQWGSVRPLAAPDQQIDAAAQRLGKT